MGLTLSRFPWLFISGGTDMSRILIVEDEVAIADLEKDYLELSGF